MRNSLRLWLALAGAAVSPAATWQIDTAHSGAQFTVRHMMVSNVRGELGGLKGKVEYDSARPESSSVEVSIDVSTINTREPKRDAHLKSADFFDVEKFPVMTFRSKRIEAAGPGKLKAVGDLTLRGVTREVVLEVETPAAPVVMRGTARTGATATTTISRKDFGVTWNRAIEAGGVAVSDAVAVTIDVAMTRPLEAK